MVRVSVYIDGFNFYYGLKRKIAEEPDWKKFYWIDFVKLFDHFKGDNQILQKVYYFTTPPNNVQKSNRQTLLFEANQLINGSRFEVVKGKFVDKTLTCAICGASYTVPEEKRTDVNISVRMMGDCAQDKTDTLILVTADSDLIPTIEFIKTNHPNKKIKVFFPPRGFSNDLNNMMRGKIVKLQNNKIKFTNCIMPDTVTAYGKSVTIPPEWKI